MVDSFIAAEKWIVYRRGKRSGSVQTMTYDTKREAMDAVKDGRKYEPQYTWTYRSTHPWTHRKPQ